MEIFQQHLKIRLWDITIRTQSIQIFFFFILAIFNFVFIFSYMPPQYGYNIDNYGAVSMTTTDDNNKVQQQLKEERSKESPSPNEHSSKLGQQQVCRTFFHIFFEF